ncbi:MAG TPA: NTP transferase domain-containing protein [Candidatus Limnocylindrales bacterium]|nr:NTP transferase domain-containing protein [Candidatus Limnocylindrales bacterium]
MTVAAVILAATPESALADADGVPRIRRIVDAAWSGGALPVVVVSFDPDGAVAAALAGASVTLAEPVPPPAGAPVAQIRRGIEVARGIVSGVDGAFVWPARMGWVSPETITSMIEAHGVQPDAVLRPTFEGDEGWPVLLPLEGVAALASVAPDRMPPDIVADVIASGLRAATIDLGDPGTTIDGSTSSSELPPYVGPTEPVTHHRHEWGSEISDAPEETPLSGPALAPYEQA